MNIVHCPRNLVAETMTYVAENFVTCLVLRVIDGTGTIRFMARGNTITYDLDLVIF